MNKKTLSACILFCLLAGLSPLKAQSKKYWVQFKDKNGTPYITTNAGAFLSTKSINRRLAYNTPVDYTDLPVNPFYQQAVDNIANVTVLFYLKWLNGVLVSIPNASSVTALNSINALSFVAGSNAVNRYKLAPLEQPVQPSEPQQDQYLRTSGTSSFSMGGSSWQNKQLNVDCLHNLGYRGQGMTIAVLDIGFNNVDNNPLFDSLRNRGGILGTRDFVVGGNSVYEDGSHGSEVLSCMAAIKPNVIMGSAPMADFWLLRTEDGATETISEEYNWIRGAEFADSVGADILTTSLGYTTFDGGLNDHNYAALNGKTAPMSIAATIAARKGMFVLNAAGNEGGSPWQFIAVAADADSICTVGAIDSLSNVAAFSSVGPTSDFRIKPDLVARGANAWIGYTNGVCFPGNGTSYATPILAGAVACFWQAHHEHNNIQILQLLKSTASNSAVPNNSRGWGTPDMCTAGAPLSLGKNSAQPVDFSIAPNPFNTAFTIGFSYAESKSITIELTDILGRVLQSAKPDGSIGSLTMSTTQLPEGIYVVRISSASGTSTKKIVKQ